MASYNRQKTKVKNNKKNPIKTLIKINIILTTLVLLSQPVVVQLITELIAKIHR